MKPNGKNICHALKTIRKQVAEANGIHYEPAPCHYDGECSGTCPACEAEVRYIEGQLGALRFAGKAVKVAGLALGMAMATGCNAPSGSRPAVDSKSVAANGNASANKPEPQVQTNATVATADDGQEPRAHWRGVRGKRARAVKRSAAAADTTTVYMTDSAGCQLPEVTVTSSPVRKISHIAGGIPCITRIVRNRQHVYLDPETKARYKKGDEAMQLFIATNTQLPVDTAAPSAQGFVRVACVVERNGRLSATRVIQSLTPKCDAEAVRVVKLMPRWRPARAARKRVRSLVVIDVPFGMK